MSRMLRGHVSVRPDAWKRGCAEWKAIREELVAAQPDRTVTALQVSLEQARRRIEREEAGER